MQRKAKAATMTYRATGKVISTDPSGLEGDTTTWEYDLATGLELRKTYADGKGTVKTYDAYNNLATVTDARGVVATYSYDIPRGLLTGIDFSDDTPTQKFTYNFLGQTVSVQDASGERSISYDHYGQTNEEVQPIAGASYALQEHWDAYGRSTGYALLKDGASQCEASTTYGTLGRIHSAGFTHEGTVHQFRYGYLAGSNLLQSLAMPNGVTLTQSYEEKRDLLTGMDYVRDNSLVTQREYNYDALGRPTTRDTRYPDKAIHHADSYTYDKRSQLIGALLGEDAYAYSYDNIGNREIAQEAAEDITYDANDLNQYTRISTNGENFTPEYDADGNQTLVQTTTGIWHVTYNGQNRAVRFESEDGRTVITCDYDYMGRRFEKKVVTNGTTTLHERYIYRGYLQIAAYDLREGHAEHPDLRFIIWAPTQEVATRPLAIRENGVWYTYGWDLTKNICELYGQEGFIRTIYTYSPYGQVTAEGDATQCIQWSSEMYDAELGLVYYNFRYYNSLDGRWTRRDILGEDAGNNLYAYVYNASTNTIDYIGLEQTKCTVTIVWGHGNDVDQYIEDNYQNYDPTTTAFGPFGCQVAPAPAGYAIPGFPNLQNSNLGDKNRGKENNKKNNAGLNPNEGKTLKDRRQGFANALKQALKSAQQEAKKICENSCCKSVDVIFKGIRDRSGTKGTKILGRRLKDTNSIYKDLSSYEKRKITCPKKKK